MSAEHIYPIGGDRMNTDTYSIRAIAHDLLDEIQTERNDAYNRGIGEIEHDDAQAGALARFGEGHDPKTLARALWIAIADRLSENAG